MADRCAAVRDLTTDAERCPRRDRCALHQRYLQGPGAEPAALWACQTEAFEAFAPVPCAGKTTRVSNRPHPLCRTSCARWAYGTPNGITPDFRDIDGVASCADRVAFHDSAKVGDASPACAPTR